MHESSNSGVLSPLINTEEIFSENQNINQNIQPSPPPFSKFIYFTAFFSAFITAFPFFAMFLKGSDYETSYGNYYSLVFTFMGLISITSSLSNWEKRIYSGFFLNISVFLFFSLLPFTSFINGNSAFFSVLILSIILSGSAGYAQSPLFSFISLLSPVYIQAMLSGQAVAYATSSTPPNLNTQTELPKGLKIRTFICFSVSSLIVLFSLSLIFFMKKLPVYTQQIEYFDFINQPIPEETFQITLPEQGSPLKEKLANIIEILSDTANYSHTLVMVFVVTLSIFPTLTAKVNISNPQYHIPFLVEWHFVLFNVGDCIGRFSASFFNIHMSFAFSVFEYLYGVLNRIFALSSLNRLQISKNHFFSILILLGAYLRWAFAPIFYSMSKCSSSNINFTPQTLSSIPFGEITPALAGVPQYLSHSTSSSLRNIYFLILDLIFGISNGYLASVALMDGPQHSKDPGLAAGVMSFVLNFGLTLGSIISFPISSKC
ncbi:hypothetical protein BB560_006493 [Smittium megazygosporum]|uniref:Nucleoside transporter n=1 Tax=Smittium megazygosporum TaxID=133381 RepID=A0A2T9Y515_9FUNG|nr:hypothetical protein BB560_006493 [Smittium megazygosporum]